MLKLKLVLAKFLQFCFNRIKRHKSLVRIVKFFYDHLPELIRKKLYTAVFVISFAKPTHGVRQSHLYENTPQTEILYKKIMSLEETLK